MIWWCGLWGQWYGLLEAIKKCFSISGAFICTEKSRETKAQRSRFIFVGKISELLRCAWQASFRTAPLSACSSEVCGFLMCWILIKGPLHPPVIAPHHQHGVKSSYSALFLPVPLEVKRGVRGVPPGDWWASMAVSTGQTLKVFGLFLWYLK